MAALANSAAVVTGAGSGIGRAIALRLSKQGLKVIAVGRREAQLEETAKLAAPGSIIVVPADIADQGAPEQILKALPAESSVRFLVHNAAVLSPVGGLEQIARAEFDQALAVNVTGPLFLTQKLLPRMEQGARVLHVSSGAAHKPLDSWYGYCSSKAAFHMSYQLLARELAPREIWVGSARPGVVDTPMQEQIRATSEELFPEVQVFRDFKAKGSLVSAELVAEFFDWLLNKCPAKEFIEAEWDIRDKEHQGRWQSKE